MCIGNKSLDPNSKQLVDGILRQSHLENELLHLLLLSITQAGNESRLEPLEEEVINDSECWILETLKMNVDLMNRLQLEQFPQQGKEKPEPCKWAKTTESTGMAQLLMSQTISEQGYLHTKPSVPEFERRESWYWEFFVE